jgi:ABC-type multidrug transport system ATPase subunit
MIKLTNICLKFERKEIFKNFSTIINTNDKVLLSAPSGSGKSTFLKLLMGFALADSGDISIYGEELTENSINSIRNKIAYLPQDISLPEMIVEDFLKMVLNFESNKHINYDQIKVLTLFKHLRLSEAILKTNTNTLSGGEKQRIGIVIMQLLERKIFLLDEVTSALNSELKDIVKEYFLKMDSTVIVVSHDRCWQETNMKRLVW